MKDKNELLYKSNLELKQYNACIVEKMWAELTVDLEESKLFQVKAAILFLARTEDEIPEIIKEVNKDCESILIAATVKEERGKK